jgi:hypothetical protein
MHSGNVAVEEKYLNESRKKTKRENYSAFFQCLLGCHFDHLAQINHYTRAEIVDTHLAGPPHCFLCFLWHTLL